MSQPLRPARQTRHSTTHWVLFRLHRGVSRRCGLKSALWSCESRNPSRFDFPGRGRACAIAGLFAALVVIAATSQSAAEPIHQKPPFRLLYNSDTTHIMSCTSVWRPQRNMPLRESLFIAAVDEAADAGADAFMIAPGLGWVPWWPSEILPLQKHSDWFRQHFNLPKASTSFTNYVLNGGDFVQTTVDRCHEKGMACFISFRLNDVHHKETADAPTGSHVASVPQFYTDHPQYRLGEQPRETQISWAKHVHNWALPEVREFKFKLIEELCRKYDIDGIELDYYRAPAYFRASETNLAQRTQIMTGFVRRVREALDAHTRPGRHRWLGVRIPAQQAAHGALGIDVEQFAKAGVNLFNLSASYHTEQTTSLPEIRKRLPNASVYLEMTPVVSFNGDTKNRIHRRTTPEIFWTTANVAYQRGADGLSLFNFQYFREYHDPGMGDHDRPYTEPPFELLKPLRDPAFVARQPQHYFVGSMYRTDPRRSYPLPRKMKPGAQAKFSLDLAPPAGGWKVAGRLRIQAKVRFQPADEWTATINGTEVTATADVSESYPSVYTQMHGKPEEWRAWSVPAAVLRDGRNEVVLLCKRGAPTELIGLDLAVPAQ